jgi:hypothetical protein
MDNADHNAARVLKARGIRQLLEQKVVFKTKKTARVRGKNKVVALLQAAETQDTPATSAVCSCPRRRCRAPASVRRG